MSVPFPFHFRCIAFRAVSMRFCSFRFHTLYVQSRSNREPYRHKVTVRVQERPYSNAVRCISTEKDSDPLQASSIWPLCYRRRGECPGPEPTVSMKHYTMYDKRKRVARARSMPNATKRNTTERNETVRNETARNANTQ